VDGFTNSPHFLRHFLKGSLMSSIMKYAIFAVAVFAVVYVALNVNATRKLLGFAPKATTAAATA
jgi:hypothetical protein